MCVDIFRSSFFRRLHFCLNFPFVGWTRRAACQAITHLRHDCLREFALDREHVFQITREIFRPEFLARVGAGEPGRDSHRVAGFAHASFDEMGHPEFLSNLLGGRILAFERKRGRSRRHVHARNFLQHR